MEQQYQQSYQQQGRAEQFIANNPSEMHNPTFIELRLDTRQLLKDIEMFISAKRIFMVKNSKTGEVGEEERDVGYPLANENGITAIINIIHLSANHHTVTGNLRDDRYMDLMCITRKELTEEIVSNCYEWGIDDSKLNLIIDTIMRFLKVFLTRPIDNLERASYQQQIVSRETISEAPRKGPLQDFANGIRGK